MSRCKVHRTYGRHFKKMTLIRNTIWFVTIFGCCCCCISSVCMNRSNVVKYFGWLFWMTKSLLIFRRACTSNDYSSRNTIVVCFRKLIMKQCTTTMAVFAWIVLQTESFKCIMWNWDRSAYHEFTFSLSTRIYIYRVLTIFMILWLNV